MIDLRRPIRYIDANIEFFDVSESDIDKVFVCVANGSGMVNARILDKDLLYFYKADQYNNGDIVAANADGESVVRRFFKDEQGIRLRREIGHGEDTYVSDISILGKLIGIQRKM